MRNIGILQINEQAKKIPGCLRFDKGSAQFPFPEEFLSLLDKVKDQIKGQYFHYPKIGGEEDLKRQIVKLELQNGRLVSNKSIVITYGGMSGLFTFFSLITQPGDEVITNQYCFEGFSLLIDHFKLIQKRADLSNSKAVEETITSKTKIVILNSPENPTGKVYSQEEVKNIVELTQKRKLWLLSDEVTNQIIYDGVKWFGPSLVDERIVAVNSFSKNWFIPGIRVGWFVSVNERFVEKCNNLLSLQSVGVNLFDQLLMATILKHLDYKKFLKEKLNILSERKVLVEQTLLKSGIGWVAKVEGGMNFYINLKKDSQSIATTLLKDFRLAIIPGYLFEGKPSTYARLGFGAVDEEKIIRGIKIISSFV